MGCASVMLLCVSLAVLTSSPASSASLPTLRKEANKQGDAFWLNSFDIYQKNPQKSGFSKTDPFTESEQTDKYLSKDEEISTKPYIDAAMFRKQPNKDTVDETYGTETEAEATTSLDMSDFTMREVQMTDIMHALPRINPPIWVQETAPESVFDPIRNNEQFDTYDRYSHSIGHGVYRMRTQIF